MSCIYTSSHQGWRGKLSILHLLFVQYEIVFAFESSPTLFNFIHKVMAHVYYRTCTVRRGKQWSAV